MGRWLRRESVLPLMRPVKGTATVKWCGQRLLGEHGGWATPLGTMRISLGDIPEEDPQEAGGTSSCQTRTHPWKPAAASSSIPVADGEHVQLFKNQPVTGWTWRGGG